MKMFKIFVCTITIGLAIVFNLTLFGVVSHLWLLSYMVTASCAYCLYIFIGE